MISQVTYQGHTSVLSFAEWTSVESYLLKWMGKPICLTIRFESITEQLTYFQDVTRLCKSVILAQQVRQMTAWDIRVYGFDQQEYPIDLAA
ncbi:MAG: hypothetical protein RIG62_03470 [Cyclobacteriaceae bacterium]